MARPKKILDYNIIDGLAQLQCTQEEMASVLDVSVRTLQRDKEFCRIYKKGMENGKVSLRRLQWKSAKDGDKVMLIWLGKQYLDQKENRREDNIDFEVINNNIKNISDLIKKPAEVRTENDLNE